ncbi:short chain dehydrogenase family protein [Metarhizium robertsii]|uniref:Short-chain dehydrogenase n=2 Tax=Metarhizium robertsii TaxID=568076 RepID=E9F586_METRA|nr:short-chain dehydrogenase [Metarhizium robertsii ARSEF 23]EFY97139.1 short-chain dehydrogenase [Metarhizium robertsii ARSEF 23]EXV00559.1 short chain dehydrogenase family protein [Metarhizium robertsii]
MFKHLIDQLSQLYPPKPLFTEFELPDLKEKVYIVTGANTGVGKELSRILYSKNARIYMAARSQEKTLSAISEIKSSLPSSTGDLIFLPLDLADLTTIASSARQFLDREPKLHVLFNNAGVMNPPKGSATKQGYELQLGVNNLGTFLFTKLLSQRLVETAAAEEPGTVRVVWVASSAAEAPVVPRGGVDMKDIGRRLDKAEFTSYALSKAGNYLHAVEMAKRFRDKGVVSIALNPGNLDSELWRTQTAFMSRVLKTFVLHPPKFGAYTELFAGLSPIVTLDRSGHWIGPWGRFLTIRGDLKKAAEDGNSEAFWNWTEEQVKQYETPAN